MGFEPGNQLGKGRPKGSKNKSNLFKAFVLEMDRLGFDIHAEWIKAIREGNHDLANAISKAFPHVSQRPLEETHNVNENHDATAEENILDKLTLQDKIDLLGKLSNSKQISK